MRISDWSSDVCSSDLQCAGRAQTSGLQIAGRIQHLLHTRTATRPFVADDHDVAGLHLAAENRLDRRILAFQHDGGTGEFQNAFVDAHSFDDAAALGEIAVQHRKAAVLAVGVGFAADAALFTIGVERSEEHTSELQSLMRISYAVFCLKKKKNNI